MRKLMLWLSLSFVFTAQLCAVLTNLNTQNNSYQSLLQWVTLKNDVVESHVEDNYGSIQALLEDNNKETLFSNHYMPLLRELIKTSVDQKNQDKAHSTSFTHHPFLNSEKNKKKDFKNFRNELRNHFGHAGTNIKIKE